MSAQESKIALFFLSVRKIRRGVSTNVSTSTPRNGGLGYKFPPSLWAFVPLICKRRPETRGALTAERSNRRYGAGNGNPGFEAGVHALSLDQDFFSRPTSPALWLRYSFGEAPVSHGLLVRYDIRFADSNGGQGFRRCFMSFLRRSHILRLLSPGRIPEAVYLCGCLQCHRKRSRQHPD